MRRHAVGGLVALALCAALLACAKHHVAASSDPSAVPPARSTAGRSGLVGDGGRAGNRTPPGRAGSSPSGGAGVGGGR
ncbi:MAG TPA: hypothetical protein VK509_19430, partial [Polyangiales bacterium]|nr:hypothetical protein [Polyangiales bacterium]